MGAIDWLAGGGETNVERYQGFTEEELQKQRAAQEGARGGQGWLSGVYRDRIAGDAPSVAERQLAETTAQNQQQQMAMSRSGTGPLGNAGAQYESARNAAGINQAANRQGATLRAQEQMAAEQNLGALYGQQRAQDQSQFQNEIGYQTMKADSFNAYANAQAQADEAYKSRRGSGAAGLVGAAGGALAMLSDPSTKSGIAPAGGGGTDWLGALGGGLSGYAAGYSGKPIEIKKKGDKPAPSASEATAPEMQPADKNWSELVAYDTRAKALEAQKAEAQRRSDAALTAPGGPYDRTGVPAPLTSDEAAMIRGDRQWGYEDVYQSSDPANKSGVAYSGSANWLDGVEPVSYQYRDPDVNAASGAMTATGDPSPLASYAPEDAKRVGVLTTDLKKTPEGASMVVPTPRGDAIDPARATGPILAATADQERRLRELEGRIKPEGPEESDRQRTIREAMEWSRGEVADMQREGNQRYNEMARIPLRREAVDEQPRRLAMRATGRDDRRMPTAGLVASSDVRPIRPGLTPAGVSNDDMLRAREQNPVAVDAAQRRQLERMRVPEGRPDLDYSTPRPQPRPETPEDVMARLDRLERAYSATMGTQPAPGRMARR